MKDQSLLDEDEVRAAFWEQHPEFTEVPGGQNRQSCDCRCAFVDFVDHLARNGVITDELAQEVTL